MIVSEGESFRLLANVPCVGVQRSTTSEFIIQTNYVHKEGVTVVSLLAAHDQHSVLPVSGKCAPVHPAIANTLQICKDLVISSFIDYICMNIACF